jgi:hypothetical protein
MTNPTFRAALSQPEPEWHQAIAKRAIESCLAQRDEVLAAFIAKYGFQPEGVIQVEQRQPDGTSTWRIERRPGPKPEELRVEDLEATARAAEIQPEPVAPTDGELQVFYDEHFISWSKWRCNQETCTFEIYLLRAALARWGTPAIKPVPVGERPPGVKDCDEMRRCWFWCKAVKTWDFRSRNRQMVHDTHWLPHWALPVPDAEVQS